VVDLPEKFVVIFEKSIFDHFCLVSMLNMGHYITGITHTKGLRFFKSIDEKEFELFLGSHVLMVVRTVWVVFVVEYKTPGEFFLFFLKAY
jgi:hypothetical protein